MNDDTAISLINVSKVFKRYHHPVDRLKELLLPGRSRAEEFWALRNINLTIPRGETVGIVGRNGSGKSTLLQTIVGTLQPTTGEVRSRGRVSALLELGSGFNPEFTGRQNIFFNGQILGLSKVEIEAKLDDIMAFADIGEFIDQPVKTYSSGMFVRLGFSVAVHVEPEIFIVDEALAVGDMFFQHRCMRKIQKLMDSGVTTLFVSHDAGAVRSLCNQAVLLHDGSVREIGTPNIILSKYASMVTELEIERDISNKNQQSIQPSLEAAMENTDGIIQAEIFKEAIELPVVRRGDKRIEITKTELIGTDKDAEGQLVLDFDQNVHLRVHLISYAAMQSCIVGYFVCDKNGNEILGTNTEQEGFLIENVQQCSRFYVDFYFRTPLRTGTYSVTVAVAEDQLSVTSDWIDNALIFQVLPPENGRKICGIVSMPIEIAIHR